MSIYAFSEAELRSRFIKNIGNRDDIDVYIEVPVFCRSVDLVIQEKQNAEIFAIEFKLHDWKRAIQQAQSVGLCFDYLYITIQKYILFARIFERQFKTKKLMLISRMYLLHLISQ